MELEFLGTGGATATPGPLCTCAVCTEARAKGVPYSRGGPCLFVHGPDLLIDTPEEVRLLLDRSRATRVEAVLYSHWHPDHTMGRRVFEGLNMDFRGWPPQHSCTPVYLPQQVADDFESYLGSGEHLDYLAARGVIEAVTVPDGEAIRLGGTTVRPFRLAEDYVYAFVLEEDGRRALVAMDELNGWMPPPELGHFDVAVLPVGIFEHDPRTGGRTISEEHPVLRAEATYEETLAMVDALDADRIYLTHVEEMNRLSYDDLRELEPALAEQGRPVVFAYDTLVFEV